MKYLITVSAFWISRMVSNSMSSGDLEFLKVKIIDQERTIGSISVKNDCRM